MSSSDIFLILDKVPLRLDLLLKLYIWRFWLVCIKINIVMQNIPSIVSGHIDFSLYSTSYSTHPLLTSLYQIWLIVIKTILQRNIITTLAEFALKSLTSLFNPFISNSVESPSEILIVNIFDNPTFQCIHICIMLLKPIIKVVLKIPVLFLLQIDHNLLLAINRERVQII